MQQKLLIMKKRNDIINKWENQSYRKQNVCHICKKEFSANDKKYYKVRDHRHFTVKYKSVAHNICNLRYKIPNKLLQYFIIVLNMIIIS